MGIGLGIVLLVIGLILALDVVELRHRASSTTRALGWIFLVVGVLAHRRWRCVMNAQRSRTTHVEERRYDDRGRR